MKELGRALYGSQNYLLSNENSDKDYKVFLCPEFSDLYSAHKADKNDLDKTLDDEHYSVLDVRKFADLVLKGGNVNTLEYLFSLELTGNTDFLEWCRQVRELYSRGYLLVVWQNFIASLEGMIKNSLRRYGENNKTISRAYYFYKFAETLVLDRFEVYASTWRMNPWNKTAWLMRFEPGFWMPTEEELQNNLNTLKMTADKKIENYKVYYGDTLNSLCKDADSLANKMQDLVYNQVFQR